MEYDDSLELILATKNKSSLISLKISLFGAHFANSGPFLYDVTLVFFAFYDDLGNLKQEMNVQLTVKRILWAYFCHDFAAE